MAALKTRNRAVMFRLTQGEYEGLKAACCAKNMNFSEFARSELLALAGSGDAWQTLHAQLNEISGQLMNLDLLLREIYRAMNQSTVAIQQEER